MSIEQYLKEIQQALDKKEYGIYQIEVDIRALAGTNKVSYVVLVNDARTKEDEVLAVCATYAELEHTLDGINSVIDFMLAIEE